MTKLYFIIALCGLEIAIYTYAWNQGIAKCRRENTQHFINQITEQNKKQRILDVEIYHTNLRDIRRVLREKYTIAE